MSVLIKGMEMPRACSQCFLYHEAEEGIGTLSDHCGVGWRKIPRKVEKPDWCPLEEAEPVKHGRWIKHIDDLFPEESMEECSVCHKWQYLDGDDDNYCPNCGAKMDEGE